VFHGGETAHLLVHSGPEVGGIQASSTAGSIFSHADQIYQTTQDLVFDQTNVATLELPAISVDSVIWLGNNLGELRLGVDSRTVTAERVGIAVARVKYTVRAKALGLSSPLTIERQTKFPIYVQVAGNVIDAIGDGEIVCQRGDGEFPGEDVHEPLLSGTQEMLSRGRAEIDAGENFQEVQISCVFRPGIAPGHLVEIHDAMMGRSWRGKVTGVRHTVVVPKVITSIDILRPIP